MKINVKPIETLKLEFEDGIIHECKFSAYAMMVLDEEFGGFVKTFEEAQEKPFEGGAKLLYAGMKACDNDTTLDFAKQIVSYLSIDNILDLFRFAKDTIQLESKKKMKQPQDFKRKQQKK